MSEITKTYKNTRWDGLVNYPCGSNSAAPPKNIENSSNPKSLINLIKYFPLIEIKEIEE